MKRMYGVVSLLFTALILGACAGIPYESAEALATLAADYGIPVTVEGLVAPVRGSTDVIAEDTPSATAASAVENGDGAQADNFEAPRDGNTASQEQTSPAPSDTPLPNAPTQTPGSQPANPTNTALPSTLPQNTSTPVPQQPSNTNLPPSATTVPPSSTSQPTNTSAPATNTALPPTNTSAPTGGGGTCNPATNAAIESQIVQLINQQRSNQGLPALSVNNKLTNAARGHSKDMACNDFFSHNSPTTGGAGNRIAAQGYSASAWGENIAAGYGTASAVVNGWMDSSGHRANILGANYSEIGVGYAFLEGSDYGHYYTAVFASP
jgi:uncharacterized protein YkwD